MKEKIEARILEVLTKAGRPMRPTEILPLMGMAMLKPRRVYQALKRMRAKGSVDYIELSKVNYHYFLPGKLCSSEDAELNDMEWLLR